jgi:hypothetical protein
MMKARTLWLRLAKVVAGLEFVRLNTGANTTGGNSGNGVLRIRESVPDENNTTGQLNYERAGQRLFRSDSQGMLGIWGDLLEGQLGKSLCQRCALRNLLSNIAFTA